MVYGLTDEQTENIVKQLSEILEKPVEEVAKAFDIITHREVIRVARNDPSEE